MQIQSFIILDQDAGQTGPGFVAGGNIVYTHLDIPVSSCQR